MSVDADGARLDVQGEVEEVVVSEDYAQFVAEQKILSTELIEEECCAVVVNEEVDAVDMDHTDFDCLYLVEEDNVHCTGNNVWNTTNAEVVGVDSVDMVRYVVVEALLVADRIVLEDGYANLNGTKHAFKHYIDENDYVFKKRVISILISFDFLKNSIIRRFKHIAPIIFSVELWIRSIMIKPRSKLVFYVLKQRQLSLKSLVIVVVIEIKCHGNSAKKTWGNLTNSPLRSQDDYKLRGIPMMVIGKVRGYRGN